MRASESTTADVCVIGGGPSGSTIAHRLASLGYEVCLIERHPFPRDHIGASLPSSILPLLEVIGVRDRVEDAGFPRPERIMVWWSEALPEMRVQPGPPGFHVDRGEFDRLLLQNAEAKGVSVLQPAHAMRPERLSRGGWRIRVQHDGKLKEVTARLLVDAAGGRNLLSGRRNRISAPLLALHAHWRDVDGQEIEGRVEAGENEWFWYAPLGGGKSVAAVFIDPKRLSGTPRQNVNEVYRELLYRFRLFPEARLGHIEGEVQACDASIFRAERPAGLDFVKIGDANLSLDPLSSQGVQSAIASGLQAAIIVNTLARYPTNSEAAIAFYQDRQKEKTRQHAAKAAGFYQERAAVCDRAFWRQRTVFPADTKPLVFEREKLDSSRRIQLSNHAKIEKTSIIQGDVIVPAVALHHGALDRPVAFLGGVEIVPLLRRVQSGQTAQAIVRTWSERLPVELSWEIMHWLWSRKVLVPARRGLE